MSSKNIQLFSNWFNDISCDSTQLCQLFENIPGVSFFVKDKESRLMYMTEKFLPRIGLGSNEELYGKTDFDLFPPRLAEHFRRDDRLVMDSKKPSLNILELVLTARDYQIGFLQINTHW